MVLKVWEAAGAIEALELQPRYRILEGYRDENGHKIRDSEYVPDFRFRRAGRVVVVDVKGKKTQVYALKAKLFKSQYRDLDFEEWYEKDVRLHEGR